MKYSIVLFALLTAAGGAQASPFAKGNAVEGKALHGKLCDGCHADKFGGDAAKIYTRAERKVKNASGLAQRISACNAMLGLNLFPEDEANIGAHLNKTFYKFK
jgi:cytochrome c5